MTIEYLSWSPSREVFLATMAALINPITGTPLAEIDPDTGDLVPSECVRVDEIGPVVKVEAELDDEGNEIAPAVVIEGHHVNLVAYGALAELLAAGGGFEGIFPMLGDMVLMPANDNVPEGWQGTSGMRIYPAEAVNHRVRVWV